MKSSRRPVDPVCAARSMKRSSVCLSVCLSVRPSVPLSVRLSVCPIDGQQQRRVRRVCCWAPSGQETAVAGAALTLQLGCLSSNGAAARRSAADAGSVMLTTDGRGWTDFDNMFYAKLNDIMQFCRHLLAASTVIWRLICTVFCVICTYAILIIIIINAKLVQFSVVNRDRVFLPRIRQIVWYLACRSPSIYCTLCYLQFGYLQHKCTPLTNFVLFFYLI